MYKKRYDLRNLILNFTKAKSAVFSWTAMEFNLRSKTMQKVFIAIISIAILFFGCGKNASEIKLEKGTPAYQFAKDLSAKMPNLDPDKNMVLVSSKSFNLTVGGLVSEMQAAMGKNTSRFTGMPAEQMKGFIQSNAERFAERHLLLQAAAKDHKELSQAKLDSALNAVYQRSGGQEAFTKRLETQGVTIDFVKKDIREGMLIQEYLDEKVYNPVKVEEADIQQAYNEDKTASVQHILLKTQGMDEAAKANVRKKIEDLLQRAKNGEDFAGLAKQYSEDPGSKDKGGLYQDFGRGHMVKPFEDAAFSVPIGQLSDVIETQYGYHILKVVDRKKETQTLEQVRETLKQQLMRNKRRQAYEDFMAQLKKDADLKVLI